MDHLVLSSHAAAVVLVDHCCACRLVWFDALESVQLDGLGWVRLLRELQRGGEQPLPEAPQARLACPTCRGGLKPVHNRTRFGRFQVLECPKRHGHLHSHSALLAERGLVRPLLGPERRALAEERTRIECLNCGAPSDGRGDDCSYCGSPLVVVDMPRLAQALRVRLRAPEPSAAVTRPTAVAAPALSWSCRGCGAGVDPSRNSQCLRCGHLVVAPSLLNITPLLDAAEADLNAAAAAVAAATAARQGARLAAPPRRPRGWRDTGLARVGRFLRPDDGHHGLMADTPLAGWLPLLIALLLAGLWWLLA